MKRYLYCEPNQDVINRLNQACQKSIDMQSLVKLTQGLYYYKGWTISKDGGYQYPWNYEEPRSDDNPVPEHYPAKTLIECILSIDA